MGKVRISISIEGRDFSYWLDTRLASDRFSWEAEVFLDNDSIGILEGSSSKQSIPPSNWNAGFLEAMTVFEIEQTIREKRGAWW